jgi:hypothetical protein
MVAATALARLCLGLGVLANVLAERTPNVVRLLELAFIVAADLLS